MMHFALKLRVTALIVAVLTGVLSLTAISPAQAVIECAGGEPASSAVETQQIIVSEVCSDETYIGPVYTVGDISETAGLEGFGNVYYKNDNCGPCALDFAVESASTLSNLTLTALAWSDIEHNTVTVEVTRIIQKSWIMWSIHVLKSDGSPGQLELGIRGFIGPDQLTRTASGSGQGITALVASPVGSSTTPYLVFKTQSSPYTSASLGDQDNIVDQTHGALDLAFGVVSSADLSLGVMPYNTCTNPLFDANFALPGQEITQTTDPSCTPNPGPPDPGTGPGPSTGTNLDFLCNGPDGMGSSASSDFWQTEYSSMGVCETSGEISEAQFGSGNWYSSFANEYFGMLLTLDNSGDLTEVIAGPSEFSVNVNEYVFTAEDVYSAAVDNLVDVRVAREITDNWVTWNITSVYSDNASVDPQTNVQPVGPAAIDLYMAGEIKVEVGTEFVWDGDSQIHTVNHVSSSIPQQVWLSGDGSEIGFTRPDVNVPGGVVFSFGAVSDFSFTNGFYYSGACGNPSQISTVTYEDIDTDYTVNLGDYLTSDNNIIFDSDNERYMTVTDCEQLPYIDDVELWNSDDAFDGFGALWIPDQMGGKHYIFDPNGTYTEGENWAYREFHDEGVATVDANGDPTTVDLTVYLSYVDSWATWEIQAVDSTTGEDADILLTIEGNLGSDNDTVFDQQTYSNFWTSSDGFAFDPVLLWKSDQEMMIDQFDEENPDSINVVFAPTSNIVLNVGFLDLGPTDPDNDYPLASPEDISYALSEIDGLFGSGEWNIEDHPALSLNPDSALYFDAGNTTFEQVAKLSGTVSDASMTNTDDAFDDFGSVFTKDQNGNFQTEIIGDEYTFDQANNSITYIAHNVYSAIEDDYVDVAVTRTFSQNWIRWQVESVFGDAAQNNTPGYTARIEVQILGNLGSDENTSWSRVSTNNVWTSSDGHYGDPVLIWQPTGAPAVINHSQTNDNASVTFEAGSSLSLWLGLVDYESFEDRDLNTWTNECNISDRVTNQAYIAAYGIYIDIDPAMWEGDCAHATVTSDLMSVSQGDTVTLDFTLPDGSNCDNEHPNDCPTVAIFHDGNLESSGPLTYFQGTEIDWTDVGNASEMTMLEVVVYSSTFDYATDPEPARVASRRIFFNPSGVTPIPLDATLSAQIGQSVNGSQVSFDIQDLNQWTPWTLDVNSVTQTLDYSVWTQNGSVQRTLTIPSGLPAGWHHFSFRGADAANQPILATFWFEIDGSGLLLATSSTDPSLSSPGNQNGGVSGGSGNGSSSPQSPNNNNQAALENASSLSYTGSHVASFGDFALWTIALGITVLMISKRKRRIS